VIGPSTWFQHMMNMTGALERTEGEFGDILRWSGFEIVNVHRNEGFILLIEAIASTN